MRPKAIEPWKRLHSSMALNEPWYKVRRDIIELPNGTVIDDYFVSVRPDIVVVIAVSPTGLIPLVRQYKHGANQITLEFPAGTFTDESPIEAGRRELSEETGWTADTFEQIGTFFDDATKNTSRVHVVVALNAQPSESQHLDPVESAAGIELRQARVQDVKPLLDSGDISAQSSVAAGYRFLSWLNRGEGE